MLQKLLIVATENCGLYEAIIVCEELLFCIGRQLAVFTTSKDSAILNIVFNVTTSYLVAGTEKGCFAWKFDSKFLTGHQSLKRYV